MNRKVTVPVVAVNRRPEDTDEEVELVKRLAEEGAAAAAAVSTLASRVTARPPRVPLEGGVPILKDGQCLGAVGVSGATAS